MSLEVTLRVTYRGSGPKFFKISHRKPKSVPWQGRRELVVGVWGSNDPAMLGKASFNIEKLISF